MSLLNPIALAWAAVALPIAVLYVLRIRRRRQLVPTLMFWDQIFQDTRPRSLWRRLRHWLSLLLQLAFAALLVLALAEPIRSSAARKPVHYLLVLDQSASMQATDGEPTRFDQARNLAHRVVRSMRDLDQATIIAAADQPAIACGRTYHQPTLHRAIDALRPVDAPSDLPAAVALARSVDVGGQQRAILILSDNRGAKNIASFKDAAMSVNVCGRDTGNLAITGFAVRPRADNPVELQGMLKVANFTRQETEAQVRLKMDDDLYDVIVMKLPAGKEQLHSFQLVNKGGSVLRAELTTHDALALDDQALAILPAVQEKRVALVTQGNLFLESVIASHPWMKLTTTAPEGAGPVVDAADIVVYDRYVPDTLPAKPSLYVFPAKESRLWTVGSEIKQPLVSDQSKDSDLLRHVSLQNVTFNLARAINTKVPAQTVLASFEHPLLLRWAAASPPIVLLAVDINQSDLPWRTAFPILMQNTLNDLAGQSLEQPSAYRTGVLAEARPVPHHAMSAVDSHARPLPVLESRERTIIGPVVSAGLVKLRAGDKTQQLAFNLANADESDLRSPDSPGSSSFPDHRDKPGGSPASAAPSYSFPWWVLLVIAATGLSTLEWCLHQRRVID